MKTKHKTSKILKESLKYLDSGRSNSDGHQYICYCIDDTGMLGNEEVIAMISERLGNSRAVSIDGVEGWLFEQGIDTRKHSYKKVQDYRKRWVLSMIAEFEAKGD
jgi:hypothetical protein